MRQQGRLPWAVISVFAAVSLARPAPQGTAQPQRIELTGGGDLFSRKDWKSTQIAVIGSYLGVSRSAATANARRDGFQLMQDGPDPTRPSQIPCSGLECYPMYPSGYGEFLRIRFSPAETIVEIVVYAPPDKYRGRLLPQLKGQTYRFFNGPYIDSLRLDLFGRESKSERVDGGYSPVSQDIRYTYSERGIIITMSPRFTTQWGPNGPFLESVGFIFPDGPNR